MKIRPSSSKRLWPSLFVAVASVSCGGAKSDPVPPAPTPGNPALPAASASVIEVTGGPDASAPMAETKGSTKGSSKDGGAAAVSSPNNELTVKLLHSALHDKGNVFLSGTSLRNALGMTALGAKGKTLNEMSRALGVEADPQENANAAKNEMTSWQTAAGKAELAIANRIWVEKTYPIEKTFSQLAQSGYGANAAPLDFAKAPDKSRVDINAWVSESTKGRIKDLLPPGSVTAAMRTVLTNAVYFKGSWVEAFSKSATKDEPFHTDAGSAIVATMHRTATFSYVENEKVRLVGLPYLDSQLSMLVILPKREDGIQSLGNEISARDLDAWTKAAEPKKVVLALPKFTFAWGRSVKREIMTLGVRTAFTDDADFSGIAPKTKEPLFIGDVFHKAFVLVDETGTEAAAATGVVMTTMSASLDQPIEMKVDRPFLFFIRDNRSGDILFAGRVTTPKAP